MIHLSDATVLAYTKLRTRKVRTTITVIISGILFSLLVFIIVAFNGIERSVNSFSEEGLGKRYIATATDMSTFQNSLAAQYNNKDILARAKAIHAETVEAKKKEAKRLNISYDPENEVAPVEKSGNDEWLNMTADAAQKALVEYGKAHPKKDSLTTIKETLAQYKPSAYYLGESIQPIDGTFQTMKNGKETFVKPEETGYSSPGGINPYEEADDPAESGMQLLDGELTKPFILQNSSWKPDEKTIPIIITYASAEKFLGLKKLDSNSTAKQRLDRISEIRSKADVLTFDICYRNNTSKTLITTAVATQKEIDKNKNNKDFKKPSLIYGLPVAESCGSAPITSDTRTQAEKNYELRQKEFDKKFSGYKDPAQAKITLRVVGLSPGSTIGTSGLMTDIISGLLNSSLGGSWIVPRDMYNSLPADSKYSDIFMGAKLDDALQEGYMPTKQHYVEFSNATDARAAIKKHSCSLFGCSSEGVILMQFGSGSITLSEAKETLVQVLTTVALIIAGVAALIMAGTIGRMIADGRRETAVFRAIGANRGDISLIYAVYTFLLSAWVAAFAALLGVILALVLDYNFSADATASAQLMFGSSDLSRQFHMYGFVSFELLIVFCLVFLTGFVSMLLPLLRNVRRNPINDMRDE